jgi:predicted acetyltransferase
MLIALEDGEIVGSTSSQLLELTIPGPGTLPAAKINLTGLLPTHRRAGIASELMRRQLANLQARGEPVAVLTTSQSGVPSAHGFSPATESMAVALQPRRGVPRTAEAPTYRLRIVRSEEARRLIPALYDEHRLRQVGQVSRRPEFWSEWFEDLPLVRIGPSARFAVVAERAGQPVGYLTYRLSYGALRENPVDTLFVEDLIAAGGARRELWRYCMSFEQAAEVKAWNVPVDDPLRWMPGTSRVARTTALRPFLYLRLIDVRRALVARSYAGEGSVVLEVKDDVLPSNTARYRLQADSTGTACEPTERPADIQLGINELAAVYLGAVQFSTLARAGLVTVLSEQALALADALFSVTPRPWTVTDW